MTAIQADDDLRLIADSVSAYTKTDADLLRMRRLRGTLPGYEREAWDRMAEMGWTGLLIPEEYGGAGLGFAYMRVVAEGLARVLAPEPLTPVAVLAARLVLHGTNDTLKQELLASIASGERIIGAALSESASGLPGDHVETIAEPASNGFKLTGTKRFVVPGGGADGYIVAAQERGRTLLCWLPATADGLSTASMVRADGTSCQTLTLAGVAITARDVVASGEAADAAIARAVDETNVVVAAELLGAMDQSLQIALDYMRTRVQFGKPIGSFQGLQHRTVDLWMQKELAIGALDDAVRTLDGNPTAKDRALAASRAKSRCGDGALLVCREAIKLHGAMGFTDECNVGQYLQRALALSAWLGNGALHRRRFAQLADPPPSTTRSTRAPVRESPPDTDWNAMPDDEFRHEVRSFFEACYPEQLRFMQRRAKWSEIKDWTLTMSRKGWIAPAWPREHGGMGLSPAKFIIYVEEQERWGIARAPDMGILMLGPIVMRFGTPEQKKKYLPKIIACEHIWCQGYSEPNSGSDLASLRTTAVADGDHYVINGSKIWTSGANEANHMFMLARTAQTEKRQEGISFFIVPLDTPGIRMRPIRNIAGNEEFCQEFFDDVRIPKENLVGELNKGWTVAKALLGFERLNNGSPRRAQYPILKLGAIARSQGLWDDPEFQSKYTKLRLDVLDLGACYRRFADVVRNGGTPGPEASFLKVWSGESLQRLAELSIETAGEAGSLRGINDFDGEPVDILGSYYNLFGATTASGTNDIQRNIVAKRVLALPG